MQSTGWRYLSMLGGSRTIVIPTVYCCCCCKLIKDLPAVCIRTLPEQQLSALILNVNEKRPFICTKFKLKVTERLLMVVLCDWIKKTNKLKQKEHSRETSVETLSQNRFLGCLRTCVCMTLCSSRLVDSIHSEDSWLSDWSLSLSLLQANQMISTLRAHSRHRIESDGMCRSVTLRSRRGSLTDTDRRADTAMISEEGTTFWSSLTDSPLRRWRQQQQQQHGWINQELRRHATRRPSFDASLSLLWGVRI